MFERLRAAVALHRLPHDLESRGLAPRLGGEGLQHFALMLDRPPEVVLYAVDAHVNLVQVPSPGRVLVHGRHPALANLAGDLSAVNHVAMSARNLGVRHPVASRRCPQPRRGCQLQIADRQAPAGAPTPPLTVVTAASWIAAKSAAFWASLAASAVDTSDATSAWITPGSWFTWSMMAWSVGRGFHVSQSPKDVRQEDVHRRRGLPAVKEVASRAEATRSEEQAHGRPQGWRLERALRAAVSESARARRCGVSDCGGIAVDSSLTSARRLPQLKLGKTNHGTRCRPGWTNPRVRGVLRFKRARPSSRRHQRCAWKVGDRHRVL